MTAASLLADLTSRGVVLTEVDGAVQVEASKGEITGADLQAIRQHKVEMVELLIARRVMYQQAIAHAFTNPSTREEIGPLWMTAPGGFGPCAPSSPGGLCSPPQPATRPPGVCDRCWSDQHKDVPIHSGRSIRRDCAKCGKFIDFVKWNPPRGHPRP